MNPMGMDQTGEAMIRWRRELHRIPELEFDLEKTRSYLVRQLEDMGYQPDLKWGNGGVVVSIEGKDPGRTVAFRADMDALSVTELTEVPFASEHPGSMHACGHDGHMAALLGLAHRLRASDPPPVSVLLIFQPAEEGPGGAELLVREGLLDSYSVEAIFGTHLFPGLSQGMIGLRSGPFMAQNGEVDLYVTGASAHGAQPHQGIDAIVAAADLVLRLQTIASRSVSPMDSMVLTFGRIEGGERCNIIPGEVKLEGTMRAFRDEVFRNVQSRIAAHASGTEAAFGVSTRVVFRDMYPAVTNDPALTEMLKQTLLPSEWVEMDPQMLAEDFAFYQKKVPGVFFFVGTGNPDKGFVHPLHNARFNFDEGVLMTVLETNLKVLKAFGELSGCVR